MAATRTISGLVALLGLMAAGCSTPAKVSGPEDARYVVDEDRPLAGYLEHRGRRYRVDHLFDARQRAASRDPFVRQFDPRNTLADWAGL
jgi:hypothetical protein